MFTEETAVRFARQHHVQPKIWHEIWKRYLAEYDLESLAGYFQYKTGQKISINSLRRWLRMTEIYCRANHIMLMGVRAVQSEYFGEYEEMVIKEVLRGMRYSNVKEPRIVL